MHATADRVLQVAFFEGGKRVRDLVAVSIFQEDDVSMQPFIEG